MFKLQTLDKNRIETLFLDQMFNPLPFWVIFSKYAFRLITLSNIDIAETVNIPITLQ